ncbi:spore cortex biosynthesis protein YabQ [Ornithinibacillus halotolerans]|uniref:Spore cortex biosynthesis protein YabQ n=1 Tax=Ornithinibacillus halotolerans TaxID=1274357 RepID=A0A916RUF2_9BACI|nr:spore cortex biosynthesis protein YabQ [Ornithinibacillus halotolerans]GGA70962.1 spore cortex biosynthesis protein YabQ [Ornithinibacillus halotolerans]
MTLSVQFLTMVSMIGGGFYLGMALDTFRRFQRHWKHNVFLVYFMEISFWLTQVFILYYILFQVNLGELRLYVFVACLLGFAAYQALAVNLYKRLLERMIIIISRIYEWISRLMKALIITPIKYIFQLLIAAVIFLFNMILHILKFLLNCIYIPIKWLFVKIYTLLPEKFKLFLQQLAGFYSKIKNICNKVFKFLTTKRR